MGDIPEHNSIWMETFLNSPFGHSFRQVALFSNLYIKSKISSLNVNLWAHSSLLPEQAPSLLSVTSLSISALRNTGGLQQISRETEVRKVGRNVQMVVCQTKKV